MAEEAQQRVETAVSNFVDDIERDHLRRMQDSAVIPDAVVVFSKPKGFSTLSSLSCNKGNGIVDLSKSEDIMTFTEVDDIVRIANFSLYATQLQSVQSSSRSIGITGKLPRIEPFMHWGVIVEFEPDGAVYTFDADTTGPLTGGDFVVKVMKDYPKGVQSIKKVGSVQLSPKELIERARKVTSGHGKYEFVFSNCQSWANQFCREISPTFAGELPTTVGEITTWVAAAGAAVASVAFAGWGIIKTLQYSRQNKKDGERKHC